MTLSARGTAVTRLWESDCKDCRAERDALAAAAPGGKGAASPSFEYSAAWVDRVLQRGGSRSDRCEFHRRAHAQAIKALAVPYIDLQTLGEVADQANPTGPLGGLGPLPVLHAEKVGAGVDLGGFKFGMSDEDILTILAGLTDKRVAVVEAGTGTGKSTFMPFRLMNPPPGAALQVKEFGPIVVTEPRRAAATGVARYVGEELCFGCDSKTCDRHIGPGFPVGYQVSGEKRWDTACDLIYVTDGTMINWVRDGQLSKIGMVIIDEAHERSENIDIILAQLREQLRVHQHLRVIITSATLDRDFFVAYFGGEQAVFTCSIPATKSFGYGVPLLVDLKIDEGVIESGLSLGDTIAFPGWSSQGPDTGDGPEDLRATTRALASLRCVEEIEITRWRDKMPDAVARQVVAIAEGTQWGDILAFLPTSEVIANTVKAISRALAAKGLEFDVFPLLSTTDPKISEQARAARSRGDKRKIVVSSNLAETSLTVEGVRYVVDSGLICQSEWDPALVSGGFPTKPHSQSGLRQRWGRVGRDAPGWVFPLYTAEQFLSLAKNTAPESTRVNLESFHAKLVSSGLDMDEAVLPGDFVHDEAALDKQGREDIEVFRRESARARRTLTATGMTDAHGHLTEFGRELERFPGGGSNALAMMLADQLACVHEVALALEVLGQGRLIGEREESLLRVDPEWPPAWRARAVQCHRALAVGCEDDLDVLLRIA